MLRESIAWDLPQLQGCVFMALSSRLSSSGLNSKSVAAGLIRYLVIIRACAVTNKPPSTGGDAHQGAGSSPRSSAARPAQAVVMVFGL